MIFVLQVCACVCVCARMSVWVWTLRKYVYVCACITVWFTVLYLSVRVMPCHCALPDCVPRNSAVCGCLGAASVRHCDPCFAAVKY